MLRQNFITEKAFRPTTVISVWASLLLVITATHLSLAQIELAPIWRTLPPDVTFKKQLANARTSTALTPMLLPFWDDFSLNTSPVGLNISYPNDTLWENSRRVWVNDHMGINPPSIWVATFDGYDSVGKPYAKNDILAKGFADRLTSRPLRMDQVALANRPNVFMSFFYQIQGNGERPDVGDVLSLEFKDNQGIWSEVWKVEANDQLDKTKFDTVRIKNLSDKYFHDKFQFRFKNFGRISGPYDTWNVDYVYVSNGGPISQPISGTVFKDFPDRTIVRGPDSFIKDYQSMPIKHFRSGSSVNVQDSIGALLTNQRKDQSELNKNPQFYSYGASVRINATKNNVTSSTNIVLANNKPTGRDLYYQKLDTFYIQNLKTILSSTDLNVDLLTLNFKFNLNGRDNTSKKKSGSLDNGDFDTVAYKKINFRNNDTTRTTYIFDDYYAYDDGSAEYGAKITGIGTQLAYEFNLKTPAPDILVAIDYCFPPFGDESTQSVQFHVLGALTGQDADYLYRRNTVIKRSANSGFIRETLGSPVTVQGKFYIGWRLLSNAIISVGLDRSFDSSNKMFVNTSGVWDPVTNLKGSLMIRPVFIREGQAVPPVGVEDEPFALPYPNPSNGVFYLPSQAKQISVYTITGQMIECAIEDELDKKKITVPSSSTGIYLVRYFADKWFTKKIVVAR